jgi:hypothetical protein
MKHGFVFTVMAMAPVCWFGTGSLAATVDFESLPVGTKFGEAYSNIPGEIVLTEGGVDMSVEEFLLGSFVGFIKAETGGRYIDSFPTTPLELDNISVLFDYSGLDFDVTTVTLEYRDFGGASNLGINGQAIHQLDAIIDIPAEVAPGVAASVADGTITLTGEISSLIIGGQELAIDNVVALPEPGTLGLLALGGVLLIRRRGH